MEQLLKSLELEVVKIFPSRVPFGLNAGKLAVFVDLAKCNLSCSNCVESAVKEAGVNKSISLVIDEIKNLSGRIVCIGGGEPFLQKDSVIELCEKLLELNYTVILKTNCTIDWAGLPIEVLVSAHISVPSSGCEKFNYYELLKKLTEEDELIIEVRTRMDFDWITNFLSLFKVTFFTNVFLIPTGGVYGKNLWRWAVGEDRVRLGLNLNKVIGAI